VNRLFFAAKLSAAIKAVLVPTMLSAIQPSSSSAVAEGVTIMTRNVYSGYDPFRVFPDYNRCLDMACRVRVITDAYDNVLANDFAARVETIASEVQQKQPHLIGLQELSLWRSGPHTDGGLPDPTPDATTIEIDYFALLLDALRAKGLSYEPMIVVQGDVGEFPRQVGIDANGNPILEDIRQTGIGTILARTDLPPSQFQVSNPQSGRYAINSTRRWESVDVTVDGHSFRLITTQLSRDPHEQAFMALELVDPEGPAGTDLPPIIIGDFNLNVDTTPVSAHTTLLDAGFTDAWTAVHPGEPGYTCCQAEVLTNFPSQLSGKFDVVLSRNGLVALDAELVGEEPADRTPSGLWPSDHAGVIVTFGPQSSFLPGDFNQDGNVDAADYVVWRKSDGTPASYDKWRANFGASLGPGSGSAGYGHRDSGPGASAEPLSSAIPEPSAICLCALAAACAVIGYHRSSFGTRRVTHPGL
jgi:endonuclease/exonuclease/phosphatase family metal-dependent hydrolase